MGAGTRKRIRETTRTRTEPGAKEEAAIGEEQEQEGGGGEEKQEEIQG